MTERAEPKKWPRLAEKNIGSTPLDEGGFFKIGRVDTEILRRFTCGQDDCTEGIYPLIREQGVRNVKQEQEVFDRYKDLSIRIHQAKITNG